MGERVFVGSCNGYFRAFDRRTGDLVWAHDTREEGEAVEFHGDPVLAGGLLLVGSDLRSADGEGRVYAFDPASGAVRWTRPAGHGVATDLAVFGGRAFAVTLDDEILALDVQSGSPVWRFGTGTRNEEFRMTSMPAARDGRVFFGGLDGIVYALDAGTGAVRWKRPLGARVSTSVLESGGFLYVGTEDGRLHRLNAETGQTVASLATREPPYGRLAAAGPCVLTFVGEHAVGCADAALGRMIWTHSPEGKLSSARPYASNGFAILGDESGNVQAVRLTDGAPGWAVRLEGVVRGIGIVGDELYVGTLGGRVYARMAPG